MTRTRHEATVFAAMKIGGNCWLASRRAVSIRRTNGRIEPLRGRTLRRARLSHSEMRVTCPQLSPRQVFRVGRWPSQGSEVSLRLSLLPLKRSRLSSLRAFSAEIGVARFPRFGAGNGSYVDRTSACVSGSRPPTWAIPRNHFRFCMIGH
jgi:hypothetical protein